MPKRPLDLWKFVVPAAAIFAVGCQTAGRAYDAEFAQEARRIHQAPSLPPAAAINPVAEELAGPHSLDTYVRHALTHNPDIQVARKLVEAAAYQVPQASSLADPMLAMKAYPEPIQTASGQQNFSMGVSQKFPWFGKLQAQANTAQCNTNVARAQLAAVELSVIEEVKRAYYELYFVQESIRITETDRVLLVGLTEIAASKYRTSAASQQDVLRAQLEVSNLEGELIRLHRQLQNAQSRLARQLSVSPDTAVLAVDQLSDDEIPSDLQSLYEKAIEARPELHAQLAAVRRDRHSVQRAKLNYYPDPTLGLTWIDTATSGISPVANGRDAFLLGVGVNMPIYRKRIDAGVREAQAKTVAGTRRYDSLKDQTQQQIKDLFVQAQSQQELLILFREDIIPKADQTLRVSSSAYQTGDVDFLQLIDNWRQLLKFHLAYQRQESQLRQTLASLERVVGGFEAYEEATGRTTQFVSVPVRDFREGEAPAEPQFREGEAPAEPQDRATNGSSETLVREVNYTTRSSVAQQELRSPGSPEQPPIASANSVIGRFNASRQTTSESVELVESSPPPLPQDNSIEYKPAPLPGGLVEFMRAAPPTRRPRRGQVEAGITQGY